MRWLLLLLLVPLFSLAQSAHFKTITTKEGLSNNSINCISNHTDGSVWIGTWDGLNLYDGRQIKVFKHDAQNTESIGGNDIYALIRDKQKRLWILTDGQAISLYLENDTFKNYSFKGTPQVLGLDDAGNIIVQLDTKQWYTFKHDSFIPLDTKSTLPNTKHLVSDARKKSPQYVTNVLLLEQIRRHFSTYVVNTVTPEDNGNIWVGTSTSGVYLVKREGNGFSILEQHKVDPQNPFSLLSNEIMVLHHDVFGNIWVGTKDGGVSIMPRIHASVDYVYAHNTKQPNLPHETIRAIAVDQLGGKWLGYYTQGLFYQQNKDSAFKSIVIQKQAEDEDWKRIRSIYVDSNGAVWVGTYAGVVRIQGDRQEYFQEVHTPYFKKNRTYAFAEDLNHNLWIGSWGGVSKFNAISQRVESFINQDKLDKYHIRHISILDNQLILSTEEHGVVFYNCRSGEINILNQESGLLGNSVFSTYADAFTGDLWVATLGGISIFDTDNKLKKQIKEEQGLPSHLIYSLMPYHSDMWISTTKGIAAIDKKTYNVLNYSNYIGWQGLEFSEGAYSQNKKGVLLYGGNKGLNIIDPSVINVYEQEARFKVIINGEMMTNEKVVTFEPEDNKIRLTLYPIGFNQYPINQFEYRIVGLFDDWRALPQRDINLDDLDHKLYRIEVRNTEDRAKSIIYTCSFEIEKPYFLQPYFIILFVVVIGMGIFWRVRAKQRVIRKREIELRKQVRDRTREVEAQKTNLITKNIQLSKLNIEINQQKEELLALHSKLKSEDIEMENFRIFLLSRIKKPIVNTLATLEELKVDDELKVDLVFAYDLVREWDHVEQVKDFDVSELVSVDLWEFIEHLREEWLVVRDRFGVVLEVINDVGASWCEVDLLRVKLALRYLLHECYKYMSSDEIMTVHFYLENNNLVIALKSRSTLLLSFWSDSRRFSPYYRVFDTLLQGLGGAIAPVDLTSFHLEIKVPVVVIEEDSLHAKEAHWNEFLEELKVLPKDKMNILVYSKEEDKPIVKQLLGANEQVNLVYNHSVSKVVGNIEHYKYDALVLYNTSLSDRTLSLFSQIKKYAHKQRLLIFVIAEEVDYFLQEQLSQLGVSDFIHLPVSKSTLENKVYKRIRYDKQNKESNTMMWKANLSEEDVVAHLSPNERLFRKGMDLVHEHFSDAAFGVEQLTLVLGVSKMKCYRLFKEFVDLSPLEILIEMRLQKAKRLVEKGDLTISEICFECGFNDPKYFSKSFKKRFDHSPSYFRND